MIGSFFRMHTFLNAYVYYLPNSEVLNENKCLFSLRQGVSVNVHSKHHSGETFRLIFPDFHTQTRNKSLEFTQNGAIRLKQTALALS